MPPDPGRAASDALLVSTDALFAPPDALWVSADGFFAGKKRRRVWKLERVTGKWIIRFAQTRHRECSAAGPRGPGEPARFSPARFLFTFANFPLTFPDMNMPAPTMLRRSLKLFALLPVLLSLAALRPATAADAEAPAKPVVRIVVLKGAYDDHPAAPGFDPTSLLLGDLEKPASLFALCEKLDTLEDFSRIVVVAATSRTDVVDPSLVAPGRLDRLVEVPLPDAAAQQQILELTRARAEQAADRRLVGDLDFRSLLPPMGGHLAAFQTEAQAKMALGCLNSNLFYWFVTVFSDCRHVNKREVDAFPISLDAIARSSGNALVKLAEILMGDLQWNSVERTMRFSHDTLRVQCIYPKASKPIIDKIDGVLAKHYGLTDEELDFIVNYDIKYRVGSDDDGDED